MWKNYEFSIVSTAILWVVTNGHLTPSIVDPKEMKSVLNKILNSIPIDMQLGFEENFDIWHVYTYSIATLLMQNDEIHLIMEISITDWDLTIKLIQVYDIPVPVSDNDNAHAEVGMFVQDDLSSNYLAVAWSDFRSLSKTDYEDGTFGAGRFCLELTHMVNADHSDSCIFALYTENYAIITKQCSVKFVEKHLPYVRSAVCCMGPLAEN